MKDKCTLRQEDVGVWNECWVWTSFIWFLWEKARLLAPIPDSPMRHQFVLLPLHLNNHRETFLCSSSYFIPAPTCTLQLQSSSYVFTIFRYSMKECGYLWKSGVPWLCILLRAILASVYSEISSAVPSLSFVCRKVSWILADWSQAAAH